MKNQNRNNKAPTLIKTYFGGHSIGKLLYNPAVVAIAYAVFGALWLATTDALVEWLFPDQRNYVIAQFIKGIIFIVTTSLVVYWLGSRGC